MIAVTGATGHLGRLAVAELLKSVPAVEIVALARTPSKAADLAAKGVQVREADYARPETLGPALQGVDSVLFISASEVGKREAQHRAVIDAAKQAGVKYLAYTSLLGGDRSPLSLLAKEHVATEKMLRESGLPHAVLRNGWYHENYTENLGSAKEHGVLMGSAGEGRISAATRQDFAEAATLVVRDPSRAGQVYELAGDEAYTMSQLASVLSKKLGKPVSYQDLPEEKYAEALEGFGLPAPVAAMLADCDVGASKGGLFDDSKTLSKLIGRPTTTLEQAVTAALAK